MRNYKVYRMIFQEHLMLDITDASLLAMLFKQNNDIFQAISGKSQYFLPATYIRIYKHVSSTIPEANTVQFFFFKKTL